MIDQKIQNLKQIINQERKILSELDSLEKNTSASSPFINSQIKELVQKLREQNKKGINEMSQIHLIKPLMPKKEDFEKKLPFKKVEMQKLSSPKDKEIKRIFKKSEKNVLKKKKPYKLSAMEKNTLKRLNKVEKKVEIKVDAKPSLFINLANKMFFNLSRSLSKEPFFKSLEKDLNKTNLQFILPSYIAVMFFSMFITFIIAIFVSIFFLFFNIEANLPIITLVQENLGLRFLKVFWIVIVFPIAAFVLSYFYPSMERRASETKINQELPFATIHMAAISGSMVEPSKIFKIILSTGDYPFIGKELTKLLNEISIYGKDLVTALKRTAYDCPSSKLTDLLNGLATTINSGGNLPDFFSKRAETLLFEHKLEKEKSAKAAETFMDIYISVVIAAPMILMLLLVMMKISGLGLALSTSMIGFVMVLGVSVLNVIFLTFLFLKNPKE